VDLARLQRLVVEAEHGDRGWVPLITVDNFSYEGADSDKLIQSHRDGIYGARAT
jgi:hypothetical protein